jgi:hypothetical protein
MFISGCPLGQPVSNYILMPTSMRVTLLSRLNVRAKTARGLDRLNPLHTVSSLARDITRVSTHL